MYPKNSPKVAKKSPKRRDYVIDFFSFCNCKSDIKNICAKFLIKILNRLQQTEKYTPKRAKKYPTLTPSGGEHAMEKSFCVMTFIAIPKTFLQNFMRKY